METKIKKTIYEWLPDAVNEIKSKNVSDYEILHTVSNYCIKIIETPGGREKAN